MKRTAMKPRTSALRPGKPPRRKKRDPKEFARIHHSVERVKWVNSLGCLAGLYQLPTPCEGPIQNAHRRNDGMSRKGGYETVFPACHAHHVAYDEYRPPFTKDSPWRVIAWGLANQVEKAWRHLTRMETDA